MDATLAVVLIATGVLVLLAVVAHVLSDRDRPHANPYVALAGSAK